MPYKNKEDAKKWCQGKKRKDYMREYNKNYRIKNIDKISKQNEQWRKDNPEKLKKYYSKYQETKNGKARRQREYSKRSAKERLMINTLTAEEWIDILKKYKFKCAYCGKEFTLFDRETKDHVIPISKGGNNVKENIVPACKSCNSKKHNKLIKPTPPFN